MSIFRKGLLLEWHISFNSILDIYNIIWQDSNFEGLLVKFDSFET